MRNTIGIFRLLRGAGRSLSWAVWALKFALTLALVIGFSRFARSGALVFVAWSFWVLWGALMSSPMKRYGRGFVRWLFRLITARRAAAADAYAGLDDKDVQRAETSDRALTDWERFSTVVGLAIPYVEQVPVRAGLGRKELVELDAVATPALYERRDTPYGFDLVIEVMGDRGQTVEDVQRAEAKLAAFFGEKVIVTPDPDRPHARAVIAVHIFDVLDSTAVVTDSADLDDWFDEPAAAAIDLDSLFEPEGGK